mmetsp:Transcript_103431/g.183752  ORF Transcript_103431/g.183752 Transcript_103431/m.183752 type:complete len:317 (-) Transcript_103431:251-1201(-)|eukprot:CAMPEP_0197642582 /NCGR_PEP_ID=MMETSP1338-20131121/16199_1 /TAXON_ID=43686 ORGANISM="Pelagodinium beii, Strain RCC1491" /NCGR_SAMPLE_ID=MMETSP1338 /ASSEMBLY_ACC=CAM_ASM_000754 /LENGTH=316 /DNA_ID=CAMNT_0043215723 /DNA_START=63 /DNA_END=1013 /DNA_ORIENTATION=+
MAIFRALLWLWLVRTFASAETWHCPTGYCLERVYLGDIASSYICSRHSKARPDLCAVETRRCVCDGYTKFGDYDSDTWTNETLSNGTAITCNIDGYGGGPDPAIGRLKMCTCRPEGEAEQTEIQEPDYQPVAVVNAATTPSTITDFESMGYNMSSEVACVHWHLLLTVPAVVSSLILEVHVRLAGDLALAQFLNDSSPEFLNVTMGETTVCVIRLDYPGTGMNAKSIFDRTDNLDMDEMKRSTVEVIRPFSAAIALGLSLITFEPDDLPENPELTTTSTTISDELTSEISTAVLLSHFRFGWLTVWLAPCLQALLS